LQDPQQAEFAGDNFIRYTGDVKQFSESQLYEITAQEIGSDIHMNALPTLTAKVSKSSVSVTQSVTPAQAYGEFKARKESADASKIDVLYAKYIPPLTSTPHFRIKHGACQVRRRAAQCQCAAVWHAVGAERVVCGVQRRRQRAERGRSCSPSVQV
jgi:hypothetical protein